MNKSSDIRVQEALKKNTAHINYFVPKMKNSYCANNELEITMPVIETRDGVEKATHGDVKVKEGTCTNHKRNGSKFCQECSDEHNGVEHVPVKPKKVVVHKKKD